MPKRSICGLIPGPAGQFTVTASVGNSFVYSFVYSGLNSPDLILDFNFTLHFRVKLISVIKLVIRPVIKPSEPESYCSKIRNYHFTTIHNHLYVSTVQPTLHRPFQTLSNSPAEPHY